MADADTVRSAAPKPQYPQQFQSTVRPNINPGQVVTRPDANFAPSPLRRIDSKGNILVNQGRPAAGPVGISGQPIRPPAGQQPRPQVQGNWVGSPTSQNLPSNRPPFLYGPQGQNIPGRPAFIRTPGQHPVTAPNQPPYRPPFPQQLPLQPQQQRPPVPTSVVNPNQNTQNRNMSNELQSRSNSFISNEDDDDVIIRPSGTPQKTGQPPNPMSQSIYGSFEKNDDSWNKLPSANTKTPIYGLDNSTTEKPLHFKPPTSPNQPATAIDRTLQRTPSAGPTPTAPKNIKEEVVIKKQEILNRTAPPDGGRRSIQPDKNAEMPNMERRKSRSAKGDNDSGVDESTQGNERNGPESPGSPVKSPTKSGLSRPGSATPSIKSNKSRSTSRQRLSLKTPDPEPLKKVSMNKIQVGHAPSPNLKAVRSKIGSLDNASYKPGGGNVKIETKKIDIKATPKIEAKNDKYIPKGGDKKIVSTKLQWAAKSKIGSLENAHHKPGGGDKKIETLKPDFKDKAKPKVGSKDNVKHAPGGGDIKIQTHKLEIKAHSKIGSLDNVKHKPGGGDKKIFDDKEYLKNVEHPVPVALTPPSQSPIPPTMMNSSGADENLNQQQS